MKDHPTLHSLRTNTSPIQVCCLVRFSLLSLFTFGWHTTPLAAQEKNIMDRKIPIIEVDSITQKASSTIPFDRPFILKIWTEEKPPYAFAYIGKRSRSGLQMAERDFRKLSESQKCTCLEESISDIDKSITARKNQIYVIDDCLMELPAKNYSAPQESKEKRVEIRNRLRQLYKERRTQLDATEKEAKRKSRFKRRRFRSHCELPIYQITKDRIELTEKDGKKFLLIHFMEPEHFIAPGQNLSVVLPTLIGKGLDIVKVWHGGATDSALALTMALRNKQILDWNFLFLVPRPDALKDIHKRVAPLLDTITHVEKEMSLYEHASECICPGPELHRLLAQALVDTLAQRVDCLTDCDLLKDMLALRELDAKNLDQLIEGRRLLHAATEIKELPKRIAALKDTQKRIDRIVAYSETQVILRTIPTATELIATQKAVKRVSSDLGSIAKSQAQIEEKLIWSFAEPDETTGTTAIFDFDTRSAFRAIPDFGLVIYGFQKDFFRPMPYFGVQFNVRQCNKSIPWNRYPNKTFWHHMSFSVGYTAAKLTSTDEREDFFSKSSLMTGAGWRITHALRVTGGAMWFYALDPNPALDIKRLKYTPYIGLSVDIDLEKYLSGITNALKP